MLDKVNRAYERIWAGRKSLDCEQELQKRTFEEVIGRANLEIGNIEKQCCPSFVDWCDRIFCCCSAQGVTKSEEQLEQKV